MAGTKKWNLSPPCSSHPKQNNRATAIVNNLGFSSLDTSVITKLFDTLDLITTNGQIVATTSVLLGSGGPYLVYPRYTVALNLKAVDQVDHLSLSFLSWF